MWKCLEYLKYLKYLEYLKRVKQAPAGRQAGSRLITIL